jgi:hypothetical protein
MTLLLPILLSLCGLGQSTDSPFVPEDALPDGAIEITLTDGRVLQAELDVKSTADELWLHWRRPNIALARPFAWSQIDRAIVAGQSLSGAEFRTLVGQVRAELPLPAAPQRWVMQGRDDEVEEVAYRTSREPASPPRVAWIEIDVRAANWDGDVAADGLFVRVYPYDAQGELVPVAGTLEVALFGERTGVVRMQQPFARLGQWTHVVRLEDVGPRGTGIRLPFQGVHPEFDSPLLPHGLVHARLSVPGQGTFEASDAMVRIRPYSAVRDRLQMQTGRRFFPGELTGDGRR